MTAKEFEDIIEKGTSNAIKKILGEFNVDRETHYKHHTWLSGLFWFGHKAKLTTWVIFIGAGATGLVKLLWEFAVFILKSQGGV